MSGTLEAAPQRGHQARVLVGDHQPHLGQAALRAAVMKPFQKTSSSLSPTSRPEDLPLTGRAHARGDHVSAYDDTTWEVWLRTCR